MKVLLKTSWVVGHAKLMRRYRKSTGKGDLREVPDELYDKLPSSAVVVEPPKHLVEPELDLEAAAERVSEEPNASRVMKEVMKSGDGPDENIETFGQLANRESDDPVEAAKKALEKVVDPEPVAKPVKRKVKARKSAA